MKQTLLLLGFGIVAAAMAFAQTGNKTASGARTSPPIPNRMPAAQAPPTATTPSPASLSQPHAPNSNPRNAPSADTKVNSGNQREPSQERLMAVPMVDPAAGNDGTPPPPH
jgi:hypothetical protein